MKSFITLTLLVVVSLATVERDSNQQAMEGLWEYNQLSGPFTVSDCGTDQDQKDAFLFAGYILKKADITSTADINPLMKEVEDFYYSLPKAVRDCFESNEEVNNLGKLYGLDNYNEDELQNKVSNWVGTHFFVYKRLIKTAGSDWNSKQDYNQAGQDLGELLQRIMNDSQM